MAIDEVDALLAKQREPLVYYLNRLPGTTLILISNGFQDLKRLPPREKVSAFCALTARICLSSGVTVRVEVDRERMQATPWVRLTFVWVSLTSRAS